MLEISSSSVTLAWVAPPLVEQNGYLTGYSVNYSTGAGPWHTVRRVKESHITLSGLQPHKEVVVSVAAANINGTGPYTLPLVLQTPADSEWGCQECIPSLPVPTLTYSTYLLSTRSAAKCHPLSYAATESGSTVPPPTTTTTSGCRNCTSWLLVALITIGILVSLTIVAGLLMARYYSRK